MTTLAREPRSNDKAAAQTAAMRNLVPAASAFAAAVASFLIVYELCRWQSAEANPAIFAAVLAIAFSRRAKPIDGAGALTIALSFIGLALVATGEGLLLQRVPALGAVVFTVLLALAVWLRNFGARGRNAGTMISLPLVTMLIVPAAAHAPGGALVDFALVVCAGVAALICVALSRWAFRLSGDRSGAALPPEPDSPPRVAAGMTTATKMALQMGVAVAAAFAVGFAVFPRHWAWTVLTAFIVLTGARGRGDAAYKGILRLAGALAGTIAAAALAQIYLPSGVPEACLIFAVLFLGIWLRENNYAFWACAVTLILAMLQGTSSVGTIDLLGARLAAILIGAICAVAAAWFVYPIRTESVIRRRLADALVALDELVQGAPPDSRERALAQLDRRMSELESAAAPVRWHRRIFAARDANHPANWIDAANAIHGHARSIRSRRRRRKPRIPTKSDRSVAPSHRKPRKVRRNAASTSNLRRASHRARSDRAKRRHRACR